MENKQNDQVCCPKFDPTLWDGKILEWNDKRFIKDKVFTLFYIPINFGAIMTKNSKILEKNNTKMLDGLCLSDCTSKWNMNVYLSVDKEIPGVNNVILSGKFLAKVYEGDFKDVGMWHQDFQAYAKSQGAEVNKKIYTWYTTCPKCAKKYGKNYVVIFGQI